MKIISRILSVVSMLFATTSFAASAYIDCPPIETLMANAAFNKGRYVAEEQRWYMTTPGFKHRLQTWNLWLAAPLPGVDRVEDALIKGVEYLKSGIQIQVPRPQFEGGYTFCFYSKAADAYAVMAMTPPVDANNFRKI